MAWYEAYCPSPFWGGVVAVVFYNTVVINPISFLSLVLGVIMGSIVTLVVVSYLLANGYIYICQELVGALAKTLDNNPILSTLANPLFTSLLTRGMFSPPRPSPSPPPCFFPSRSTVNPPSEGARNESEVHSPTPEEVVEDVMNNTNTDDLSNNKVVTPDDGEEVSDTPVEEDDTFEMVNAPVQENKPVQVETDSE